MTPTAVGVSPQPTLEDASAVGRFRERSVPARTSRRAARKRVTVRAERHDSVQGVWQRLLETQSGRHLRDRIDAHRVDKFAVVIISTDL
jgi:hypothetical protein